MIVGNWPAYWSAEAHRGFLKREESLAIINDSYKSVVSHSGYGLREVRAEKGAAEIWIFLLDLRPANYQIFRQSLCWNNCDFHLMSGANSVCLKSTPNTMSQFTSSG